MSREAKNIYNGVTLPTTEVNALEELERLIQENGSLREGESIPVVQETIHSRFAHFLGQKIHCLARLGPKSDDKTEFFPTW